MFCISHKHQLSREVRVHGLNTPQRISAGHLCVWALWVKSMVSRALGRPTSRDGEDGVKATREMCWIEMDSSPDANSSPKNPHTEDWSRSPQLWKHSALFTRTLFINEFFGHVLMHKGSDCSQIYADCSNMVNIEHQSIGLCHPSTFLCTIISVVGSRKVNKRCLWVEDCHFPYSVQCAEAAG